MRYLAVAVLALLVAGTAFSQGRFGVKAGPLLSYINTDGNNGGTFSDVKAGFTFSFSYSMPASKNFAVQPEFNYTALRADESLTNSSVHLEYIQIPVLLKGVTNNERFGIYAGPQLGFIVNASNKVDGGAKTDITQDVTETDFSAMFGFEYITPINLTINVRYVQGFSNVFKVEYDTFKSRHQYGAVTIGYLFGRKKKQ